MAPRATERAPTTVCILYRAQPKDAFEPRDRFVEVWTYRFIRIRLGKMRQRNKRSWRVIRIRHAAGEWRPRPASWRGASVRMPFAILLLKQPTAHSIAIVKVVQLPRRRQG